MLENAWITSRTVPEVLKENQQGGKIPPTQVRVKIEWYRENK